jgi:hypothetical protein
MTWIAPVLNLLRFKHEQRFRHFSAGPPRQERLNFITYWYTKRLHLSQKCIPLGQLRAKRKILASEVAFCWTLSILKIRSDDIPNKSYF